MGILNQSTKMRIESFLYSKVKLILESQYNIEGVVDINKKNSTKLIFKDKKHAVKLVSEAIKDFALEHNLSINDVKDFLLEIIEKDMKLNNMYKLEYEAIEETILMPIDQEQEDAR